MPTERPRLNRLEVYYCLAVFAAFSVMALLLVNSGRERGEYLQATIKSLFCTLLALLPIGIAIEFAYRRREVHAFVVACIMLTVFMWIQYIGMLFPGGDDYPR